MLPEITVHRPHGVVPKLVVRKRTVVDYHPSWLLLALPVVAVAAAARRRSGPKTRPVQPGTSAPGDTAPAPRRGRRRVVIVRLARLRRRPGAPTTVEVADVAVPVQQDDRTS